MFTLLWLSTWAQELCEELMSTVKELSDENDSDRPEIVKARYRHLEY